MKKSLLKLAGAALLAFALSNAVHAAYIDGTIQFQGAVSVNEAGGNTSISFGAPQTVIFANGDYTGVAGVATFSNFTYSGTGLLLNPSIVGGSVASLWQIAGFSFDLFAITIAGAGPSGFAIYGSGVAYGAGYQATSATWSIQGTGSGYVFEAAANSTTAVPDGGTTALLVGVALLGLGVISRRKAV